MTQVPVTSAAHQTSFCLIFRLLHGKMFDISDRQNSGKRLPAQDVRYGGVDYVEESCGIPLRIRRL